MTSVLTELFLMLLVILIAAEIFTNALEHLGQKLGISEGVTGSLFAAVGTALPETLVPILAIMGGTASAAVNEEINWRRGDFGCAVDAGHTFHLFNGLVRTQKPWTVWAYPPRKQWLCAGFKLLYCGVCAGSSGDVYAANVRRL